MAQDPRFNYNFTDMDTETLLHLAQYANEPQHRYHTCGWMVDQSLCGESVQGHNFAEHLRTRHGIVGPDKAQLTCCWSKCFAGMKKESVTRHVQEKHLEWRYPCPNCPERFTRSYTMQNHIARMHSGR